MARFIRSLILVLAAPLMTMSLPHFALGAEESGFDAIDRMLEESFEEIDLTLDEQFEMLDQAMEDAYKRMSTEIEVRWGEDEVRLPTKTEWVDYSDDLSFRRTIDFEHGVIKLERLVNLGDRAAAIVEEMQSAAKSVQSDTLADLSKRDLAMKYARESLEREGIEIAPPPQQSIGEPVLEGVDELVPDDETIEGLVEDALSAPSSDETEPAPDKAASGARPDHASASVADLGEEKRKIEVQIPFAPDYRTRLAHRYEQSVIREARRQNVRPSLLFAVMETESSFNPRATSAVPAYGLMQLVPRSGAMDAYNHVYGEMTLLDPEYLYQPEKNVELGSAYLNLLLNRYLRAIRNPESRRYCAIAAYNTGAGNVARAFTGDTQVSGAATIINRMQPREVYEFLKSNLPYDETRRYVEKVTSAQQRYLTYDQPFSS